MISILSVRDVAAYTTFLYAHLVVCARVCHRTHVVAQNWREKVSPSCYTVEDNHACFDTQRLSLKGKANRDKITERERDRKREKR